MQDPLVLTQQFNDLATYPTNANQQFDIPKNDM